jgi:hypothetical protein
MRAQCPVAAHRLEGVAARAVDRRVNRRERILLEDMADIFEGRLADVAGDLEPGIAGRRPPSVISQPPAHPKTTRGLGQEPEWLRFSSMLVGRPGLAGNPLCSQARRRERQNRLQNIRLSSRSSS